MDVDLGHLSRPCSCGEEHRLGTEYICIEPGAVERLEDILGPYQNPVFICDSNTRDAAKPYLKEEFKDYLVIELKPDGLICDEKHIRKVLSQLEVCDLGLSSVPVDVLVAIGGGTVHDLTRYVADEYKIPFVSVPTSASADGYTSSVAMYRKDGMIRYQYASAPRWVLADTNIFTKAPYRLTAAGISEIYSKYTALFDWKIAHLVTGEYFCERIYNMVKAIAEDIPRLSEDVHDGDPEACERLMKHLLMLGLAEQMMNTTRAVSGAEHYVARLWSMQVINGPIDAYHGESVGIAFLQVLERYKKLGKAIRKDKVHATDESARGLEIHMLEEAFTDPKMLDDILEENEPNPLDDIDLEVFEEKIDEIADEIRDLPSVSKVTEQMQQAGCVTDPKALGLSPDVCSRSLDLAPYVRSRMTFLRLAKLLA